MAIENEQPRFRDYALQLKARSGPAFFGTVTSSVLSLDPEETPERIKQAMQNLTLNDKQKDLLKKFVTHILSLVEGKAHINAPRELVNFTQQGLATVPGYRPPEGDLSQKLKK